MISLSDLINPLTADEVKATAYSILETMEFPIASWAKGAVVRTIIAVVASTIAPFTDLQVAVTRSGFLDWAEDLWLDVVGEQVYSTPRVLATFATGFITLTNAGGGSYTKAARTFKVFNPATGKVYINTAGFTLNPMQTDLPPVPIEALEQGSASTSAAATITGQETPLLGVSVTNAAEVIGFDKESDPLYRERCRLQVGSVSPAGAAAAYEYIARTPELNGGVVVTRTRAITESTTGNVTLYVAGPSGAVTGPDVAKIQDAIDKLAVPLCVDCTVVSAAALVLNVTATAYVYTTVAMTPSEVDTAVTEHFSEWVPTLKIGGDHDGLGGSGTVYLDRIRSEIHKAVDAVTVLMSVPNVDFPVATNQCVVLGTVNISVLQVTP